MTGNPFKKMTGRPRKIESPEQMRELLIEYFEPGGDAWMQEKDNPVFRPTINGLAVACGMHRSNFHEYEKREGFRDVIRDARALVELAHERNLYGAAVTGSIFALKAHFGWRDNDEVRSEEDNEKNFNFTFNVAPPKSDIKVTKDDDA